MWCLGASTYACNDVCFYDDTMAYIRLNISVRSVGPVSTFLYCACSFVLQILFTPLLILSRKSTHTKANKYAGRFLYLNTIEIHVVSFCILLNSHTFYFLLSLLRHKQSNKAIILMDNFFILEAISILNCYLWIKFRYILLCLFIKWAHRIPGLDIKCKFKIDCVICSIPFNNMLVKLTIEFQLK